MDIEAAVALLVELSGISGADGGLHDARALAEALDCHPVALRLAAAYLARPPTEGQVHRRATPPRTFAAYHTLVAAARAERDRTVRDRTVRAAGSPAPGLSAGARGGGAEQLPTEAEAQAAAVTDAAAVEVACGISLDRLRDEGLAPAEPLLQLLTCFGGGHPIRSELFSADLLADSPVATGSERLTGRRLRDVVEALAAMALVADVTIERPAAGGLPGLACLVVPAAIAAAVRARLARSHRAEAIWLAAAEALYRASPGDPNDMAGWETLPAVHIALLRGLPGRLDEALARAVADAVIAVAYLATFGNSSAANTLSELLIARAADIPGDPEVQFGARLIRAVVLSEQGRAIEAELLLRDLSELAEQEYGADSDAANDIRALRAMVLVQLNRLDEAEREYARLGDAAAGSAAAGAVMKLFRGDPAGAAGYVEGLGADGAELSGDGPDALLARLVRAEFLMNSGDLPAATSLLDGIAATAARLGVENSITLAAKVDRLIVHMVHGDDYDVVGELERIGELARERLGSQHPLVAFARVGVAGLRAPQAGPISPADIRLAAATREELTRTQGEEHVFTLVARLIGAAFAHRNGGRDEAEYRAVIDRATRTAGPGNLLALIARQALGKMLQDAGSGDVVPYYREMFDDVCRVFGAESVQAAGVGAELAPMLGEIGAHREAAGVLRRVRAAWVRSLGEDSSAALSAWDLLNDALYAAGDMAGLAAELERLVAVRRRLLGAEHLDTLTARNNLVAICRTAELMAPGDARAEYERILAARTRQLGTDHADSLTTRFNIANIAHTQGELAQAETEYRSVLTARLRVLGPRDPETLLTMRALVEVYLATGRPAQARAFAETLLRASRETVGPTDPRTLDAWWLLGAALSELAPRGLAERTAAVEELEEFLRVATAILGSDHQATLAAAAKLRELAA